MANKIHEYPWMVAGNFNEEPTGHGSVATTLQQFGGSLEIDWLATNKLQWCTHPQVLVDKALSDHKAIALQLNTSQRLPSRCRYKPQPH